MDWLPSPAAPWHAAHIWNSCLPANKSGSALAFTGESEKKNTTIMFASFNFISPIPCLVSFIVLHLLLSCEEELSHCYL